MPIASIDRELCSGCGLCVDTCPEDVLRLDTRPAGQERPPCADVCPAGVSVRNYSYLIELGQVEEAEEALQEYLPFPAITGRVCPHFCETRCARGDVDGAVNIHSLERYVGDSALKRRAERPPTLFAARVAIVGSGPAGLACAFYLRKMGYPVTVFEALPEPGGMLRVGIPAYRLPREILNRQIEAFCEMGIEFQTNTTVGRDISFEALSAQYQAVFLALGRHKSREAGIEGGELSGTERGLDFLRSVSLGKKPPVGKSVIVVGGGNVAVDVALSALRLRAEEVRIVCRNSREDMPAFESEIRQAVEEGVVIRPASALKRIVGENGRVSAVELISCVQGLDGSGRFFRRYGEDVTESLRADQVILAVGQSADYEGMPVSLCPEKDFVSVNPVTLETILPGVYAGGDIVRSQGGSVAQAAASGRRAAESIDRFLRGVDQEEGREAPPKLRRPPREGIPRFPRQSAAKLPVSARIGDFDEIQGGFSENEARLEAQRCMTCGSKAVIRYAEDCMLCLYCESGCPSKAIYVSPDRPARRMAPWD